MNHKAFSTKFTLSNIIVILICLLAIVITLLIVVNRNPGPPVYSIRASYGIDVDNPQEVVGEGDYVFVGKVLQKIGTEYENKTPKELEDGSTILIGTAYTYYEVTVIDNLKNKLVTNTPIIISKAGGIREDASAYDIFEDDELPQVGKHYMFIANTQSDGTLLVSGANSNIPFNYPSNILKTKQTIEQTDKFQVYKNAVENEIFIDEDILTSEYDVTN